MLAEAEFSPSLHQQRGWGPASSKFSEPDPQVGDEGQVVRRHEGRARAGELDGPDLDMPLVVDVIQVQHREDARVRAPAFQVRVDVDAFEEGVEGLRRQAPRPLVEVAEDDLRSLYPPIVDEGRQPRRLVAALEDRGAEMDVALLQAGRRDREPGARKRKTASWRRSPRSSTLGEGRQAGPALRLMPPKTARTLRTVQGSVTDGPFAETKEHLLGFYIVDAADQDDAGRDRQGDRPRQSRRLV